MKADTQSTESGAALLTTLVLVTAIALVVVSLYSISNNEAQVSGIRMADTRSHLAERAAFEDAKNLLPNLTANDDYLVTSVMHRFPGDGNDTAGTRYTYISTPGAGSLVHTALFAGGTEQTDSMPDFNSTETSVLADGPFAAPTVSMPSTETTQEIETYGLVHLSADGEMIPENRYPKTVFHEITPGPADKFEQRYTWWIEDLEGYPNIDVVGGWTDHYEDPNGQLALDFIRPGYSSVDDRVLPGNGEPRGARIPLPETQQFAWQYPKSFRGQNFVDQVAPGLSPREIILQPWTTDSIGLHQHPFARTPDLISARHWLSPGGSYTRSTAERKENRFILGLRPYLTVPKIPYGHGYRDEGERRFPLNKLVAERDMELAAIIERNLPAFDGRKGGFPKDESYIATIAANAIDYADGDSLATLAGNTINSNMMRFRGVDAYCPVNELLIRFTFKDYVDKGEQWEIELEATVSAEFWNTFNCPVSASDMTLEFEFLDDVEFFAELGWHEFPTHDRDLDEPAENPFSYSLQPNEIQVIDLGKIRWDRISIPKSSPGSVFPIIAKLREATGKSGNSYPRATYTLLSSNDPVDRRGRPPAETPETVTTSPSYGFFFQGFPDPEKPRSLPPKKSIMRVYQGNHRIFGLHPEDGVEKSRKGSHLGDPWMNYYSRATVDNSGFRDSEYVKHSSPGLRNLSVSSVKSRPFEQRDLYADQVRVRDWPDRGYENALSLGSGVSGFGDGFGKTPKNDDDLPTSFSFPTSPQRAPWRISNLGRFYSVTELGNLHDPVMWTAGPPGSLTSITKQQYDLPENEKRTLFSGTDYERREDYLERLAPPDAQPSPIWGGGNTLRIGRPEHELFDQPSMRASQLLDLFHVGYNGSNLLSTDGDDDKLYANYDPRDHQPPPTALDPVDSATQPYSLVHDPQLHAQSEFDRVHGHININSAPTIFEIETMLRGALVTNGTLLEKDSYITPLYTYETEIGSLANTLNPEAIPLVAADLYKARPFYSPSHLARVLSELLDRYDALPEQHNDAEAEETFARMLNTTTFSSRHFRIFTYAETVQPDSEQVVARQHRVYEVFVEPVRNGDGDISRCRMQILSSRDL